MFSDLLKRLIDTDPKPVLLQISHILQTNSPGIIIQPHSGIAVRLSSFFQLYKFHF
jgi:hypothetical protein